MDNKEKVLGAIVKRISVDEKLEENLIRLLVCGLQDNVEFFFDNNGDWGDEEPFDVNDKVYLKIMGIENSNSQKIKWTDLEEGQVYLSGEFIEIFSGDTFEKFQVKPVGKRILRFDKCIKDEIKKLYFKALGGESGHGKKN